MSLCNLPSIAVPTPSFDLAALAKALLALLGITLPAMPTLPTPPPFCPLD